MTKTQQPDGTEKGLTRAEVGERAGLKAITRGRHSGRTPAPCLVDMRAETETGDSGEAISIGAATVERIAKDGTTKTIKRSHVRA